MRRNLIERRGADAVTIARRRRRSRSRSWRTRRSRSGHWFRIRAELRAQIAQKLVRSHRRFRRRRDRLVQIAARRHQIKFEVARRLGDGLFDRGLARDKGLRRRGNLRLRLLFNHLRNFRRRRRFLVEQNSFLGRFDRNRPDDRRRFVYFRRRRVNFQRSDSGHNARNLARRWLFNLEERFVFGRLSYGRRLCRRWRCRSPCHSLRRRIDRVLRKRFPFLRKIDLFFQQSRRVSMRYDSRLSFRLSDTQIKFRNLRFRRSGHRRGRRLHGCGRRRRRRHNWSNRGLGSLRRGRMGRRSLISVPQLRESFGILLIATRQKNLFQLRSKLRRPQFVPSPQRDIQQPLQRRRMTRRLLEHALQQMRGLLRQTVTREQIHIRQCLRDIFLRFFIQRRLNVHLGLLRRFLFLGRRIEIPPRRLWKRLHRRHHRRRGRYRWGSSSHPSRSRTAGNLGPRRFKPSGQFFIIGFFLE